jgi:hypothetical protein
MRAGLLERGSEINQVRKYWFYLMADVLQVCAIEVNELN